MTYVSSVIFKLYNLEQNWRWPLKYPFCLVNKTTMIQCLVNANLSLPFYNVFTRTKHFLFLFRQKNRRQPSRDRTPTGNPLLQGGLVPRRRHHRTDRWWPYFGASHHVGAAHAPQRKSQAEGTAPRDAFPTSLQLPRAAPRQGSRSQVGLRVHGSCGRPWELLPDLRQDSAVRP